MTMPQWFNEPNDIQTQEERQEALEYEYARLQMAQEEYDASSGCDKDRIYLDLLHAELRIAQMEKGV